MRSITDQRYSDIEFEEQEYISESESQTVRELQDQIERLERDLDDCQSQIFDLHEDEQVSEATIKKEYEALAFKIGRLIDNIFEEERADFGATLRSRLEDQGARRQLKYIGLHLNSHGLERISRIGTCNILVISLLIWNHLSRTTFDRDYPIGLSRSHWRTIHEAEQMMRGGSGMTSCKFNQSMMQQGLMICSKIPSKLPNGNPRHYLLLVIRKVSRNIKRRNPNRSAVTSIIH